MTHPDPSLCMDLPSQQTTPQVVVTAWHDGIEVGLLHRPSRPCHTMIGTPRCWKTPRWPSEAAHHQPLLCKGGWAGHR